LKEDQNNGHLAQMFGYDTFTLNVVSRGNYKEQQTTELRLYYENTSTSYLTDSGLHAFSSKAIYSELFFIKFLKMVFISFKYIGIQ
jgi:hypothetical protein